LAAVLASQAARVLSLAMATLIEMGEPKPAEHLYLAANGRLSTLIVGRAPLSMRDLSTLDERVRWLHYKTLAAPNRVSADPVIERILHAGTVDELIRIGGETPLNLAPTWDANPFFFNQLRLPDPSFPTSRLHAALRESGVLHGNLNASLTLLTLVFISMVVVAMVIIGPATSSTRRSSANITLWSSAYFLVLMGFMFPTGMRLCTRIDPRITPWAWAINGAAGVLATGAVVLVSINTSLNASLWVGAVAYALLAVGGPQLLKLEQASEDKMNPSAAAR
jgi:hypothetical protein